MGDPPASSPVGWLTAQAKPAAGTGRPIPPAPRLDPDPTAPPQLDLSGCSLPGPLSTGYLGSWRKGPFWQGWGPSSGLFLEGPPPPLPCLLEAAAAAAETGPRQGVLHLPSQTILPLQPGGAQCAISSDPPPSFSKTGLLKDLLSPGRGGSAWEEGVAAAPAHSPPPFADCIWMQPQRSDLLQGRFTIPPTHTHTAVRSGENFCEREGGLRVKR